jgi:hypothetical protein
MAMSRGGVTAELLTSASVPESPKSALVRRPGVWYVIPEL